MLKRVAATTVLGLALVGVSVEKAYANWTCYGPVEIVSVSRSADGGETWTLYCGGGISYW